MHQLFIAFPSQNPTKTPDGFFGSAPIQKQLRWHSSGSCLILFWVCTSRPQFQDELGVVLAPPWLKWPIQRPVQGMVSGHSMDRTLRTLVSTQQRSSALVTSGWPVHSALRFLWVHEKPFPSWESRKTGTAVLFRNRRINNGGKRAGQVIN